MKKKLLAILSAMAQGMIDAHKAQFSL